MNIKSAFFDIDGTLLSHRTGKVPESAKEAMQALRRNGIRVAVATGRSFGELDEIGVGDIEFDDYILMNGTLVTDAEKNPLVENPITGKGLEVLLESFGSNEVPILFNENTDRYMNTINDHVRGILDEIHTLYPECRPYSGNTVYQAVAYVGENAEFVQKMRNYFHVTHWHPDAVDIIAEGGSKLWGIKAYCKAKGIDLSETVAFGDASNDVEMITACGTGICMGNGTEDAKAAADYITDDIDADGILKACHHFHLI